MKPFALTCLASLVACSAKAPPAPVPAPDPKPVVTPDPKPVVAPDPKPVVAPDPKPSAAPDPAAGKPLAPAHNGFGFDLWKQLSAVEPGNLALSPASLAVAFGMTVAGARGATRAEMEKVLRLAGIADPHAAAGALVALWNGSGDAYALRVANRLFGEATHRFEPAFLDLVRAAYGAPLELVDFIGAFEPARVHINDWVAARTEDRIKDLLPPRSIDDLTRLVLVNAIYFKGQWKTRFDKALTSDATFHAPGGDELVPFMRASAPFDFGRVDGASVLQMPYVGDDLAMTIVLPDGDLAALEQQLSPAALDAWVAALHAVDEVDVRLPRFELATPSMKLKPALQAMGMRLAFEPGDADFSGMSQAPLYVSDAFHKVFVEVNEEGTEAAAATAVVMARESARLPVAFHADRPFLFFVRDLRTGHVLFMGRVADPS